MSNPESDWLTPEVLQFIQEKSYEFHILAFGEQMARLNFLTLEERKAEVRAMMDHARQRGVVVEKPATGVTP